MRSVFYILLLALCSGCVSKVSQTIARDGVIFGSNNGVTHLSVPEGEEIKGLLARHAGFSPYIIWKHSKDLVEAQLRSKSNGYDGMLVSFEKKAGHWRESAVRLGDIVP